MPQKNPLSLEVLEVLDAIERRGSFAKAAEELNKATSAVSYAVQKLEEQLDITVYQRQGRRSVLTPAGRLLLEDGRQLLQASNRLAERAREVASGWETRLRVGIDALYPFDDFFAVLAEFLQEHPNIEIDVEECVLNGGWEALEQHRIDLLVAAPGPVPKHKGYRSAALGVDDLLAVIAAKHPMAKYLKDPERFEQLLPQIRRVVSHDTSQDGIARSAGFTTEAYPLFVQNMDQKVLAVEAGIGVSHLPRSRITEQLAAGSLLALPTQKKTRNTRFLAWHLSNKGKALKALSDKLISRAGNQKL